MSTGEKSKGGQKAWTTNEQKEWLTSQLPSFVASRSSDSPSDFWASVFKGWFEKWPIGDAEGGEAVMKKKRVVSKQK